MLEFTRPVWLLLLLAIPLLVYVALKLSYASLGPFQKWGGIAMRVIIWVLLTCALAGVQFVQWSDKVSVVVAIDQSDSVDDAYIMGELAKIEEAREEMKKDDTLGKIVFGAESFLEYLPLEGVTDEMLRSQETEPRGNFTDISQAIQLAMASFPDDAQKRLVLLTDGNENMGNAIQEARIAGENDVELYVARVPSRSGEEVVLDSLDAPGVANLGEQVTVRFVVDSTVATPADVSLIRNGEFVEKVPVNIKPGQDVYEFPVQIDQSGFFTYELVLEPQFDTIKENNRAFAFSVVGGHPRLLFVAADPEEFNYLPATLLEHNIRIDMVPPGGLPYNLADFQKYDGIIFSDVAAFDITDDQMRMIQTLVRDFGRGFMMLGSDQSFGPGGYFDTPIEETLPVDMDFRRKKITPSSLVICLVDKSGSMGATVSGTTKIAMAKEACKAVVKLQTERDWVAVMGFDAVGQWVVQPTQGINKADTLAKISAMQAGGGTDLYPALNAAYLNSRDIPVQIRHVIVFTDGMVARANFQGLLADMTSDHYTVSTVAFGTDADLPFMKNLAQMGNGQAYEAGSLFDLPKIFTREVFMANKATLSEEPFAARPAASHALVNGISWRSAPLLYGYVATAPKETATVPLVTHKDDPLLAVWRYGLGKSAAFTSDARNRWARDWLPWGGYEKFWTGVARWIRSDLNSSGLSVDTEMIGGSGVIRANVVDDSGSFVNNAQLEARVTSPGLEARTVSLRQTGPGEYEGQFPISENGNYFINVVDQQADGSGALQPSRAQAAGLAVSYSPEYRDLKTNNFLISQLEMSSLGFDGLSLNELFTEERIPQKRKQPAWELFVLIALFLWLLDVAIRRLALDWVEVRASLAAMLRGGSGRRAERASASLAGLLNVKSSLEERSGRGTTRDVASRTPQEPDTPVSKPETVVRPPEREPDAASATHRRQPQRDKREAPAAESSASSLSGLRRKLSQDEPAGGRNISDLQERIRKSTAASRKRKEQEEESDTRNLSGREMTSRLLKRKRERRERQKDDD